MRKTLQAALVAMMLVSTGALAQSITFEKCGSAKRITCVVDGDTIWFEGEKIRLMDYDTPEPTTNVCGGQIERDLAAAASDRLLELLNKSQFTLPVTEKTNTGVPLLLYVWAARMLEKS